MNKQKTFHPMSEKNLTTLFRILILMLTCYALFTFVSFEMNPAKWSVWERLGAAWLFLYIFKKTNDDENNRDQTPSNHYGSRNN